MKTIYKYPINLDAPVVSLPKDSLILLFAEQDNKLFLWAEVDPEKDRVMCVFKVYGTGHKLKDNPGEYVGSVVCRSQSFVWHLYFEGEVE